MHTPATSTVEVTLCTGQCARILPHLHAIAQHARSASGCIDCTVLQSSADPDVWVISSRWRSESALLHYFEHAPESAFSQLLDSGAIGSLSFTRFVPVEPPSPPQTLPQRCHP